MDVDEDWVITMERVIFASFRVHRDTGDTREGIRRFLTPVIRVRMGAYTMWRRMHG